jgi:hypothetical protein
VVGLVIHVLLYYVKLLQVHYFSKRSMRVMSVGRQNRFFRLSMTGVIGLQLIPFALFLRSAPQCGPHKGSGLTVSAGFTLQLRRLPAYVTIILDYASNPLLLWAVISVIVIMLINVGSQQRAVKDEIKSTSIRLKLETFERNKIIKAYNLVMGYGEVRGREMFHAWLKELDEKLAAKLGAPLQEKGYGDMIRICKLTPEQLRGLLWQINNWPGNIGNNITREEAEEVMLSVEGVRLGLL